MADSVKVRWDANLFVSIILAVIFGFLGFIRLIVDVVRKGPLRVLCTRGRDVRPELLTSSAFGSHGFVRLKVNYLKIRFISADC
jgi:hypothetical protein